MGVDGAVSGQAAGGGGLGIGGCWEGLDAKAMGGDDAVVEDIVDVGLGGQAAEGGCVVFGGCGLDGGDSEVLVALGEAGAGCGDVAFGIGGDGGVVVEDEVAVWSDAAGVDLGSGDAGEEQSQEDKTAEKIAAEERRSGAVGTGRAEIRIAALEHGCTSVIGLRCPSAAEEFA